ncbi:MAG: FAD-dependent monooxygenase [Proteobacteria bacterium]|nr:FAD-dependent monooxygenase [Pseudomonadota bacterium]
MSPAPAPPVTRAAGAPPTAVDIVGAGLAGALLALLLARQGCRVTLYERRADPRQTVPERGRSINLVLAARGICALERAGILGETRPLLTALRGRMIHEGTGTPVLLPYGQREHEVIWSVGRADLNRLLIEAACRHAGVQVHFNQLCLGVDARGGTLRLRDARGGATREVAAETIIACDGAGSAVRASLADAGLLRVREERLDHDYKELTIPARAGAHAMDPGALHIWPRGGFMLIALPNTDGTFTATLFLPRAGAVSFASLDSASAVRDFFAQQFPDALALMPQLDAEFQAHPQGMMGTVHCAPWHAGARVLLLGDAAHAIVPFHGQGMNAAFEDCAELDRLLQQEGVPCTQAGWKQLFARFQEERLPDAQAIAQMALENYLEMRAEVRDARFVRLKELAMRLERRFPQRFIPRYSMVMFHPEIRYSQALQRGAVQARILEELDAAGAADAPGEPRDPTGRRDPQNRGGPEGDDLAQHLVMQRLPPLPVTSG